MIVTVHVALQLLKIRKFDGNLDSRNRMGLIDGLTFEFDFKNFFFSKRGGTQANHRGAQGEDASIHEEISSNQAFFTFYSFGWLKVRIGPLDQKTLDQNIFKKQIMH